MIAHTQFYNQADFSARAEILTEWTTTFSNILMFICLMTPKLIYLLMDCGTFNCLSTLELVRGLLRPASSVPSTDHPQFLSAISICSFQPQFSCNLMSSYKSTKEVVRVTIVNPTFCLFLYLTSVHFRGKLQRVGDVSKQKIKCWPIRTRETGDVRL